MLTSNQKDAIVASRFAQLADLSFITENESTVLAGLHEELELITKLGSEEISARRHQFFNLPGTTVADFKERGSTTGADDVTVAVIRFVGLDVNRPFVSIISTLRRVEQRELGQILAENVSVFNPHSVRMPVPESFEYQDFAQADRYTVVGDLREILGRPKVSAGKVELCVPADLGFYQAYLEEYEAFHQASPELRQEVRPESREDLQDSLEAGLLFQIFIDGNFAGVIGGDLQKYHGIQSVHVREEILFRSYRGRGFGAQAQRAFCEALDGSVKLLCGSIFHKNTSSLKTALRNGRRITEIDIFYPVHQEGSK